jgi:SAM-dependent methyltransferase
MFAQDRQPAELRALYDSSYFENYVDGRGYDDDPAQRRWEHRRRLRWLGRYARSGRLLDVGCANGGFLAAARDADFEVVGVEPAEAAAASARARGLAVMTGTLEDLPAAPGTVDVATAWHVLEHIPDPLASLQRLRSELKIGGHLLVELPNAQSVVAERDGGAWHAADLRHHVGQFGPRSLRTLLDRAGYLVLDLHTFPFFGYYRPRQWVRPEFWRGCAVTAIQVRANPVGRHPTRHELLRVAARVR